MDHGTSPTLLVFHQISGTFPGVESDDPQKEWVSVSASEKYLKKHTLDDRGIMGESIYNL